MGGTSGSEDEAAGVDLLLLVATFGRIFTDELEAVVPSPELVNNNPMVILSLLHRRGPLRPVDLQRHTRMTSGGMANALNRLEQRGLVTRELEPDVPDGRAVQVSVTDEGAALAVRLGERLVRRLADNDDFARAGLRFAIGLVGSIPTDVLLGSVFDPRDGPSGARPELT